MFASLTKPDEDVELHWLKDGKTRCTTGSVVSSLYHLKDSENQNEDAGFFVFPDLSVRTEGSYRLKLSPFEVVGYAYIFHCIPKQSLTLQSARTCITANLSSLLRFTCIPPRSSRGWKSPHRSRVPSRTKVSRFVFEKTSACVKSQACLTPRNLFLCRSMCRCHYLFLLQMVCPLSFLGLIDLMIFMAN